ncbi:MAG: tRNA pseudouridine(13) synthase TruD [Planctomycetota bacterium]
MFFLDNRGGRFLQEFRVGETLFGCLAKNPRDFASALTRGIPARERTIHLFAYQSHLWNRAVALRVQEVIPQELRGWLPGDDGALPVPLDPAPGQLAALEAVPLPLPGQGESLSSEAARLFEAVFRAEGISAEQFRELDLPGFRPRSEERSILLRPRFLRAAPAEKDDLHPRNMKMRLRFTVPRGQYPTLVAKRLALPRRPGGRRHRIWIAAHCQIFPDAWGAMPSFRSPPPGQPSRSSNPWKMPRSGRDDSRSPWKRARPSPPRENPWPARPSSSPRKGKDES